MYKIWEFLKIGWLNRTIRFHVVSRVRWNDLY